MRPGGNNFGRPNPGFRPGQFPPNPNQGFNPNDQFPPNPNQGFNPNGQFPQNANQGFNPNGQFPQNSNQGFNPSPSQGASQSNNIVPPAQTTPGSLRPPPVSTQKIINISPCTCPFTREYNPVCGSDSQTYLNAALLNCFRVCGFGELQISVSKGMFVTEICVLPY